MQVAESARTTIGTTIAELPTCDFTVDADASTESVKEAFDERADLAGAIVMDGDTDIGGRFPRRLVSPPESGRSFVRFS